VFGALGGLPVRLRRRPSLGDSSSSICSRGVYSLTYCVPSTFSCLVRLAVGLLVSGDA
jgi:hypothetical protein